MNIYKVLLENRNTGTPTTVYIKAESETIAFATAVDRYSRHYAVLGAAIIKEKEDDISPSVG